MKELIDRLSNQDFEELLAEANSNYAEEPKQEVPPVGRKLDDVKQQLEAKAAEKPSGIKERRAEKKRRAQQIIQNAINDTFLDLNAPVSQNNKRWLIAKATEKYTQYMDAQAKQINNCATKTFQRLMPRRLVKMWKTNPEMCIPFPAFDYTTSGEYNGVHTFKIEPDLPYYFEPEDCVDILKEYCFTSVAALESNIANFFRNKQTRTEREVKMAEKLIRVNNFFDLVKLNPDWYLLLREELYLQYEKDHRC